MDFVWFTLSLKTHLREELIWECGSIYLNIWPDKDPTQIYTSIQMNLRFGVIVQPLLLSLMLIPSNFAATGDVVLKHVAETSAEMFKFLLWCNCRTFSGVCGLDFT